MHARPTHSYTVTGRHDRNFLLILTFACDSVDLRSLAETSLFKGFSLGEKTGAQQKGQQWDAQQK